MFNVALAVAFRIALMPRDPIVARRFECCPIPIGMEAGLIRPVVVAAVAGLGFALLDTNDDRESVLLVVVEPRDCCSSNDDEEVE